MDQAHANIREVLRRADHIVAELNVSGTTIRIGYDESDSDPSVYIMLPDIDSEHKAFMSPCETSLFIAALVAAHCQVTGKEAE